MNKIIVLIVIVAVILGLVGVLVKPNPFCKTLRDSNICSI